MATYLDRTQSAGNRKTFTISAWVKRVNRMGTYTHLFTAGPNPGAWDTLRFDNNDQLAMRINNDAASVRTNRVFRDTNSWYHIVCAVDTTQSTASDRVKLYVNGVQETSLSLTSYPSEDHECSFNNNSLTLRIGDATWSPGTQYLDGIMSHVHYIDGTALTPSTFGSTDSTTGEWKINTDPTVSYGTNGFFLFKNDGSLSDQSGQGNNFTLTSGTLTNTEDCPSNVFPTFNSLCKTYSGSATFSNGNTTITNTQDWTNMPVNMGALSGKYYWEMKIDNVTSNVFVGVCGEGYTNDGYDLYNDSTPYNQDTGLVLYFTDGRKTVNGTDTESHYASYATGDIIGVALDLDAATKTVTFYKNGTVDPAGATNLPTNMQTGFVFPIAMVNAGSNAAKVSLNMGNGYFGTTQITDEGTNTSGIGKFEYNVPANHTALSTKGLNE